VGLIDAFCREHLDEEYRDLSRKLAGILARKRPSPLTAVPEGEGLHGLISIHMGDESDFEAKRSGTTRRPKRR
jgi:hypothetical protein